MKYKPAKAGDSLTMPLEEACRMLGVSPHNGRNLASRGEMPGAFKVGRKWKVSRKRLVAFIDGEPEKEK